MVPYYIKVIMDINDCLPEYFAVEQSGGYNVFQNTVYQSLRTHNMPASVLWPIVNAEFRTMRYFIHEKTKKATLTRKWNGSGYYPCKWCHNGIEIEMVKGNGSMIIIPVITITDTETGILPYNNRVIQPRTVTPGVHVRNGIDIKARFFTTDPLDSVSPNETTRAATVVSKENVIYMTMPPHVKKLIIADAIRNKESCPISCDEITHENATVTSCGHVFITNEIKRWLSIESSNSLCPVCKQNCNV